MHDSHHRPTLFQRPDRIADPLYVITPIINGQRFRSRWKLYEDFAKRCEEAGAILYTVEVAFGDRAHAITARDNPRHIQLRSSSEIWFKENAVNVAASRLPPEAKYIAWVDSDVRFVRDDWANETVHQLQHFDAVQMWSQYQDVTADFSVIGTMHSFMHQYHKHGCVLPTDTSVYPYTYKKGYPGAPGLAWAMRRSAWDTCGGLLDVCLLGAGDWYMAFGFVGGLTSKMVHRDNHPTYRDAILSWGDRAKQLHGNVGYVPGLAIHYWHGPKALRRYSTREQILIRRQYNPETDLIRDIQGLYRLNPSSAGLRDDCRRYFNERMEDS